MTCRPRRRPHLAERGRRRRPLQNLLGELDRPRERPWTSVSDLPRRSHVGVLEEDVRERVEVLLRGRLAIRAREQHATGGVLPPKCPPRGVNSSARLVLRTASGAEGQWFESTRVRQHLRVSRGVVARTRSKQVEGRRIAAVASVGRADSPLERARIHV